MKIARYYISLFLILVTAKASASKLQDAFEALSIHDYFKARNLFYSLNKKHYSAYASYGLSVIYYRANNPFHNYDSACKYAAISYNCFRQKPDTATFSGFPIRNGVIRAMIDSIAIKQLKLCDLEPSIKAYDTYLIRNYLASDQFKNPAIASRDELEFNRMAAVNNSDSTQAFILTHPQSGLKEAAFKLKEKQLFEEITRDKSEKSYITFIRQQPRNSYINQAYSALLELYKTSKNKEGIAAFIQKYPSAPQLVEAWQSLYALSIKTFSKEELENFIKTYPDFPFKNSVLKEVQLNDLVLIPIEKNNQIGFADTTGKIAIEPAYDEASEFTEGLSIVHKNDSVFFINKENANLFAKIFSDALPFNNGLAPVKQNAKWHLMDRAGEIKTEAYDDINELSENCYIVKQGNLYGAIDPFGEKTHAIRFDKLGDFKNGCAYYQLDGGYGFITKNGYIHKPEFEWISDFGTNGLAIYKFQNKFGLIRNNGEPLTMALYDQIIKASDWIYLIISNNSYGFYSAEGCFLSAVAYDYEKEKSAGYYTNGATLKLVKKKEQALMDLNGRISIDFGTYSEIGFASCGLIKIKKNGKYGYLDRKLNTVIACKYSTAQDFEDSLAAVSSKKGYQLINTKGEELLSSETDIERVCHNHYLTEKDGTLNLYSGKGQLLFSNVSAYERYKSYLILYLHNNQIKIISI